MFVVLNQNPLPGQFLVLISGLSFVLFFNLASSQIDFATSSAIRKANLVTLTKTSADENSLQN